MMSSAMASPLVCYLPNKKSQQVRTPVRTLRRVSKKNLTVMNCTGKLDHVIPIDLNNAVNLPVTHTWSNSLNSSSSTKAKESVPLIDLDDPQAVELIKTACENWGIFQVINHGIPVELFGQIEEQTRRFFVLPSEQKLRALRSPDSATGYGINPISRFFSRQMWSEGFSVLGSPLEHARRVWPHDYSDFCTVIDDYQEQMMGLAEKITSLMFKSLGLSREDVEWFDEPNGLPRHAFLQLNSYPNCPDPNHAMGFAQHTDSSLVTLLYQPNTIKGLQVYRPDLNWVDVEPIPNAIVVNIGDLMQIASNGRFKSVIHRAVVSKDHHRFSVVYFFSPNKHVKISPPLKLINDGDLPMYRPTSWKDYFDVKAIYFDKALEMVGFNSSLVEKNNI